MRRIFNAYPVSLAHRQLIEHGPTAMITAGGEQRQRLGIAQMPVSTIDTPLIAACKANTECVRRN